MISAAVGTTLGNPFSTRHVRPGRLPSFDAAGHPVDLAGLLARFTDLGVSAAIVGPHGSGKTTLLGHLADALEAERRRVSRVRMRGGGDARMLLGMVARARRGDIICVDSWERLGMPWAFLIQSCAAALRTRLIVTAHRAGAMPMLWECTTTPAVLSAIVARLPCSRAGVPAMPEADIEEAFFKSSGDIREALFLLYDTFEARSRADRGPSA